MWAMSQSFGFCCGYPIVGYNTGGRDPNAPGKAGGAAIAPQVLPRLASGNRQDQFTHCMTPLALPHGGLHDRRPGPVCAWQGQCGAANSQQVLFRNACRNAFSIVRRAQCAQPEEPGS